MRWLGAGQTEPMGRSHYWKALTRKTLVAVTSEMSINIPILASLDPFAAAHQGTLGFGTLYRPHRGPTTIRYRASAQYKTIEALYLGS